MLEKIRRKSNSIYILLIFGAIILVFIFWGVGPSDKQAGKDSVAVVDGNPITAREYEDLYKRQMDYFRNAFKGQFTDEMAKKMDLKKRTLDILVNRAVTIKAAKAEGIKVGEKEVQEAIMSVPAFQKNGVFDRDQYFLVLSSNRLKAADFEKAVADDILTSKMQKRVVKDVLVTDDEIKQAFIRENRKLDLRYAAVDASRFTRSVKVSDDEAKAFFQKNSSDFAVPVKVDAFYAFAGFNEFSKKARVADDEIRQFYEKNSKQFETPAKVRARHILIRPDEKTPDREKAKKEAREKAESILKRIKGGEKFPELAKKYSGDPGSASRAGDLGWFQKGMMVKPFEDAVFTLKKGEVSGIVETQFGYHIILLEDKLEAGTMPLKDVQAAIRSSLQRQKAWSMARDAALILEKSFREAQNTMALKKAAVTKEGVRFGTTGIISQGDPGAKFAKDEKVRDAVFTLKSGEVSGPIDASDGVYVVKVIERVEAHVPDYREVASKVKQALIAARAREEALKKADELLKKAAGGADFEKLAKQEGYAVQETGFFKMTDGLIPKIGVPAGELEKVFELDSNSPYYPQVYSGNGRFYIIKFKAAQEPDLNGLVSRKEEIGGRLLVRKQEEAVLKWLTGLRAKAKVQVFEETMR